MSKSGFRTIENVDEKLHKELIDCLWSVVVIADELGINLEKEFQKKIRELDERVKEIHGEYKENL